MYTSIIQKDGLEGVEKALHEYTDLRQEQTALILEELEMEMESNYFWCKRNVQTKVWPWVLDMPQAWKISL